MKCYPVIRTIYKQDVCLSSKYYIDPQVHQHAADAREIHELCSSLMRRFEVLAHQIGDNEIPDIVEFLEDGVSPICIEYVEWTFYASKKVYGSYITSKSLDILQ